MFEVEFIVNNAYWINILLGIIIIYLGRNRPARSTVMWLMVLALFPVVGFLGYLLLGANTRKAQMFEIKGDADMAITALVEDQNDYLSEVQIPYIDEGSSYRDSDLSQDFENYNELMAINLNASRAYITDNNAVTVFTDGRKKFDALIADIDRAEHNIEIEYYIVKSDGLGREVIAHLIKAARRGVHVRFLTDGIGCRKLSRTAIRKMNEAGIETAIFFPSLIRFVNFRLNYRNHRKLCSIDDAIAYIGGFNIGDEYIGKDPKFGYWRDTHLRIEGDAVGNIKLRFTQDWCYASGQDIKEQSDFAYKGRPVAGHIPCQMIASGPDTHLHTIQLAMVKMISSAKHRIDIQTPYFIPTAPVIDAIIMAIQVGVEVNLMIPSKRDHIIVFPATLSYAGQLIKEGANVYAYTGGFLHSKALLVDDACCMVGSANMDERSFHLNFEASEIVYSKKVTEHLRESFEEDIKQSVRLTPEVYAQRPLSLKISEPVCRLFGPIL